MSTAQIRLIAQEVARQVDVDPRFKFREKNAAKATLEALLEAIEGKLS